MCWWQIAEAPCVRNSLLAMYVSPFMLEWGTEQDHRASRILRDYFFVCSERRTLFAMSDQNGMPDTFMYQFVFRPFPFVGDYHAAELDYVFDHSWPLLIPLGGEYAKMGAIMGHYWTNFAKNLDPNVGSSPVVCCILLPWTDYSGRRR